MIPNIHERIDEYQTQVISEVENIFEGRQSSTVRRKRVFGTEIDEHIRLRDHVSQLYIMIENGSNELIDAIKILEDKMMDNYDEYQTMIKIETNLSGNQSYRDLAITYAHELMRTKTFQEEVPEKARLAIQREGIENLRDILSKNLEPETVATRIEELQEFKRQYLFSTTPKVIAIRRNPYPNRTSARVNNGGYK
ncbi:hypothetical protein HN385_02195 [archaeon]|jgi:hypothetical protein|nr:hypothetical protein [archaeon]MBT3450365.1 hypothetical protein [archaeon]MBT6868860.1 hypothetical protein [archaeon]MBT7192919.1 hypothetical protein [archaeon]MBT7380885.1 hypothetical protein [archaeon]